MSRFLIAAVALLAACACASADANLRGAAETDAIIEGIGNGLWHSAGFYIDFPHNASSAKAEGWVPMTDCDSNIGVMWADTKSGASKTHPVQLLFTSAGQFAGMRVTIYGDSSTSGVGNAAQPQLIQEGFWIPQSGASETWYITMSTRPASQMCSGEVQSAMLGTQIVLNQDTGLNFAVPLSAREAQAQGYAAGACIPHMGQHWELDLSYRNGSMSWVEGNLMPVVPMFYPPTIDGTIHAIFFTTPVAQPGAIEFGRAFWDTPAVTATLMCMNFCGSDCHWTTHFWSTMHIYLNSDWKTATCPGGTGISGRSCPSD